MRVLSGRLRRSSSPSSRRRSSSASSAGRPPSPAIPRALALHERHRPRRVRRALHRPQHVVGRVRQVPDHALELAGMGKRYLGNANADDAGQPGDRSRPASSRALYNWLGSWRRVAYWWLTGSSRTSGWSTSRDALREQGHGLLRQGGAGPQSRGSARTGSGAPPALPEGASTITYTGRGGRCRTRLRRWRSALRDQGRREGDVHLHGSTHHLVRPARTDPRQGRVSVDGKLVKTVDLHRSSFAARRRSSARPWAKRRPHAADRGRRDRPPPDGRPRRVRRRQLGRPVRSPGRDHLDLDPEVGGQRGHADRRPGRRLGREVPAVDRCSSPRTRRSRADTPCTLTTSP